MASPPERPPTDYGSAGVDAEAIEAGLAGLVRHIRTTWPARADGLGAIKGRPGYFASVVDFGGLGIAVCTDGIGTKALIAQMTGRYDTVGIDCVAMNVNDLICVGARPVTFVDYIAIERAEPAMLEDLGKGLAEGARLAGVSISGGEIAEMRDVIKGAVPDRGFDLAGTAVGRVALDAVNVGADVRPGDSILGIASSGIHSNGLTLARRVLFESAGLKVGDRLDDLGETVGEALLRPTHIYVREALDLLASAVPVHALVHITGDGFLNLTRIEAQVGMRLDALPDAASGPCRDPAARRHLRTRRCTASSTWASASASSCRRSTRPAPSPSSARTARRASASGRWWRTRKSACGSSRRGWSAAQERVLRERAPRPSRGRRCPPPASPRDRAGRGGAGSRSRPGPERCAPLPREHRVELLLQRMQVEHVVGGILELAPGERVRAPVRRLLLLGNLDAQQVAAEVLEAVAVGEGAREAGRDLRAVDRPAADAERVLQHGHVEAGEVEDLQHRLVGQQRREMGRVDGLARRELHQVAVAVAARELYQAEPVAMGVEAHRLGVDGHRVAEGEPRRQVAAMQMLRHGLLPSPELLARSTPATRTVTSVRHPR